MRRLTHRERVLGTAAGVVLIVAVAHSWQVMERRARHAEAIEAEVDDMRARMETARASGAGVIPRQGSIHDALREVTVSGARVAESRGRWAITWRGNGLQTWTRLALLSQARDASLTSMSIRKVGGSVDVEVVMEAPHGR